MTKKKLPQFVFGRMHFNNQHVVVIMWRGTKYFHAYFPDTPQIRSRIVSFVEEERYFVEWANSNDNPKEMKKRFLQFLNPSVITGWNREMTRATKRILERGLALVS